MTCSLATIASVGVPLLLQDVGTPRMQLGLYGQAIKAFQSERSRCTQRNCGGLVEENGAYTRRNTQKTGWAGQTCLDRDNSGSS